MYKRISTSADSEELEELQVEMIDRFGLLPEPLKLLFQLTYLKLRAATFGIKKINANISKGRIEFSAQTEVDPLSIVQLIQDEPNRYKLSGANHLQFSHETENAEDRLVFIDQLLSRLKINEKKAA
jgi:transcription-repair coupling factor (superfamily II helicase)